VCRGVANLGGLGLIAGYGDGVHKAGVALVAVQALAVEGVLLSTSISISISIALIQIQIILTNAEVEETVRLRIAQRGGVEEKSEFHLLGLRTHAETAVEDRREGHAALAVSALGLATEALAINVVLGTATEAQKMLRLRLLVLLPQTTTRKIQNLIDQHVGQLKPIVQGHAANLQVGLELKLLFHPWLEICDGAVDRHHEGGDDLPAGDLDLKIRLLELPVAPHGVGIFVKILLQFRKVGYKCSRGHTIQSLDQ